MILSIIVPAYNAEAFVGRCLDSIYTDAPSEKLFEVVVINDGSKDKTSDIIKDNCDQHKNLLLIEKENGGVSSARNCGIDAARGEYVLFLDADDELIAGALSKVCKYLAEKNPIDMLVTRQSRNNGLEERLVETPPLEENKRYSGVDAYQKQYVRTNAGGGICRVQFLQQHHLRFPEGVTNAEDTVFFTHLQVYAQSIVFYDLLLYRIHEIRGSASRNDYTKLGLRHINTLHAIAEIKAGLNVSREQRGIFDYVVYQILSNTTAYFAKSKELSYRQLQKDMAYDKLLPLDIHYMYMMQRKARLMNFSFPLFYFLSWIKYSKTRLKK